MTIDLPPKIFAPVAAWISTRIERGRGYESDEIAIIGRHESTCRKSKGQKRPKVYGQRGPKEFPFLLKSDSM